MLRYEFVCEKCKKPFELTMTIFAPELHLAQTEVTDFAAPLPFGPTVRGIGYWFRRRT